MSTDIVYDAIVIGAGVVGPCIATALSKQGHKVLIVERDWNEPNRIVGELMQPAGLNALDKLGMINAINDIEAIPSKGYYIALGNESITLEYPSKLKFPQETDRQSKDYEILHTRDSAKLHYDSTISVSNFGDQNPNFMGVAFRHGKFISNLRKIVREQPNVTWIQGTVNKILKDDLTNKANGIIVDNNNKYKGKLIVASDGIYSKFRKELNTKQPQVESYFISLSLYHAQLPEPNHGHVILNDVHSPVLIYQISPEETRILCCYNGSKLPSQQKVIEYLNNNVKKNLPKTVIASFTKALENLPQENYRIMPNQFLSAEQNTIPGLLVIGDALNMRHPLTGGGMTVGLNDVVLASKLLSQVPDFDNDAAVLEKLLEFHFERKNLDTVINTLSLALWKLFDANNRYLCILQKGCFEYFKLGGSCQEIPMSLLSGINPSPYDLFKHFFIVAFYGVYLNFHSRGLALFPIALFEAIMTLSYAAVVFVPVLTAEYFG